MTRKLTLIVAHTAMQAAEYAIARKLADWRVVVHTNDLVGTGPVTHLLAFVGDWRKRSGRCDTFARGWSRIQGAAIENESPAGSGRGGAEVLSSWKWGNRSIDSYR
jgi:hypothetical protein